MKGMTLFRQTFVLLMGALLLFTVITISMVIWLPPQRPQFFSMTDVVRTLALAVESERQAGKNVSLALPTLRLQSPPMVEDGMVEYQPFTIELARRLGVPVADVRFFYRTKIGFSLFAGSEAAQTNVGFSGGEPVFYDAFSAAVRGRDAWYVLDTPERPIINDWQRAWMVQLASMALALLPIAWWFARRLSRPIRQFAQAADRIGRDSEAPPVSLEGPAELRTAAASLNLMQARIASHLRERSAMIGAIAHDLRTPLARIAFRIEAAPEEVRDRVQADIAEMTSMISATIEFARGTSAPVVRESVDLVYLLSSLCADDRETGHLVEFESVLKADDDAIIQGDTLSLKRLFDNLVDNACKYGGSATVRLERSPSILRVAVLDSGPGIPELHLETVFEPFQRGEGSRNRATGGVGLGLTIARAIASNHGGELRLQNRPEGGLAAIVDWPLRA